MPVAYAVGLRHIFLGSPPLMLALPAALAAYLAWKRARYFGNTAPLGIALLLFVLVAGVFADLLETTHGLIVTACLSGLLIASAIWNLLQLCGADTLVRRR